MTRNINPLFKINERQFQTVIIELAQWQGWMIYHPLPAQNSRGNWRTAQAGHIGFPDLVLAHPKRGLIFAELKTAIGKLTTNQQNWIDTLRAAGAEVHVWRPTDIGAIRTRLTGDKP